MGNILDINPSDFGLPPTSPSISPSDITKTVSSGNLGVALPNPADDQNLFRKPLETGEVKLPSTFAPSTQYYDVEQIKKYNGSAEFTPTMNPLADNEKIMAENFSRWDAFTTGLSGMIDNGIAAYSEYSNFWPRLTRSIYNLDSDLFQPTEAEKQTVAEASRLVGVNNPIYYPEGVGQHDIFTRQFLASSLQNAGFTLGTMAGFATETLVFKKLGNFSKLFELGAASKSTAVASELGQSTKFLGLGTKEQALTETAENMVRNGATSRLGKQSLFDNFLKAASYVPVLGTVAETSSFVRKANAARATMGAAAFTEAEIARIGRGGVARAFQEINFAVSEANVEAGNTYGDIYNDAIESYKADNDNQDPDEDTKQIFRQRALEGSTADYGTNVAVLAIMNKMAFGNFFRKFGADNKLLNLISQDGGKFYALTKGGKNPFYKTYERKFFGALQDARDISKFFGTSAAVKQIGKDFAGNLGKIQLLEGLQENIQDGVNFAIRKHYKDIYDDKVSTWSEDFKAAVEDQWSPKGRATFLQGALTGLFISPITGSMTRVSEALNQSKEHKEQLKKVLDHLNEFGGNPEKILKEPIRNIKAQAAYNNVMTQAAQSGLKYEYFNNRSSAIIQHALYAKRTGTFGAFKTFLKSFGTEFDAQEFKQATGIDLNDFGGSSPAAFIDDLVNKLDRYSELYDKYNNQFGQYFSIESFDKDPQAKQRYNFSVAALQDAIHAVAFNEAKAEDGTIRAGDIVRTIASKSKTIGQAATSTFNTITEHQLGEVQISILANEIKTLEETEGTKTKETLDLIETKKQELALLEEWNKKAYVTTEQTLENGETIEVTNPLDFNTLTEDEQRGLADTLTKFYQVKNKQNNIKSPVSLDEVKSVLQDINDYQKLSRDTQDYMKSVNLLSDPANALKLMHSFEDARIGAFARLMHDKYTELSKVSGIFEEYIQKNPDDMNGLLKLARSPFTSVENTTKLYGHLENINKMIDKYNETAEEENRRREEENLRQKEELEKELENIKKQLYNDKESAPVNIGLMTDQEASEFTFDHYDYNFDPDTDVLESIDRIYVDADGVNQITHTASSKEVEEFFKDKPDFDIANISDADLKLFAKSYEQALYNKENGVVAAPETIQEYSVISNEVKKLKNLEGKELIYQGKRGVLRRNEKGFYIELGAEPTTTTPSGTTTKPDLEKEIKETLKNITYANGVKPYDDPNVQDELEINEASRNIANALSKGQTLTFDFLKSNLSGLFTTTNNNVIKIRINKGTGDIELSEVGTVRTIIVDKNNNISYDFEDKGKQLNLKAARAISQAESKHQDKLKDIFKKYNTVEGKSTTAKTDVEKRKQEAESKITPIDIDVVDKSGNKTGEVRIKEYATIYGKERLAAKTEQELKKLIKAKYNAEVAALEGKPTDAKADIEKSILGSFAETNERVVKSKGASNGKTLRTELVSKVSSDGEVITFKSKNSFVGEDTVVGSTPHTMTIEEFKEKFYPMLTAEEIEDFEERLELEKEDGWNGKIYFKELRVGTSKTQKNLVGQLNLEIMIGMGNEYGFKLTRRLSDTELATLEAESAEVKPVADTIELGNDSSTGPTEFTWELNKETGQLEMVDSSNELTLNDLVGLELIGDNLTEEEQANTGVTPNSQTINNHTFEYVTENTYKIDGREYIVNEDENNNLLGITYVDEDGNGVFLTVEEADKNPDSVVGRLMNVAKIARVQNNVNVTQETLDEATKVLESITPAEPIRITLKSKGQITKKLVTAMVDAMPDEVADIFDKYINNKTRSQVNETEIKKLSSWAEDTYSKLQKLDQTDDVISAINYISKNIINPINKKYGEQIVTKPKRKATKSSKAKAKTTNVSGQVTTKGPEQGAESISKEKGSGIIKAVDNAKSQIEKHRKEVAVKLEELLPSSNLFTVSDIEQVTNAAQLSAKDLNLPSKEKINKNPFDDDSSIEDFICNR